MKIIGITALIAVGIGCLYLLADVDSVSAENQFDVFIQTYKVGYSDEYEYDYRLKVFRANLDKIDEMNRRNPQATFGITKFADRTQEEMDLQRILHENDKKQCGHRTYSGTPQDSNWVGKIPQVKIKANVGQVGLLELLLQLKEDTPSSQTLQVLQNNFLFNNLSIEMISPMDVVEDSLSLDLKCF
eukprot:CAMPEP_0197001458 /NCGR_PEP_ID=MMETSP1380-20130617/6156_1 /TAXON_ID=5936 /ORGANISM="Euplotes crassus, Strain CT5" /LENGTH=185 /DNA_ID=CAMNT_0042419139 /DNA_START=7 /DNA_END=565 /DNA_ORIENTATION=+